MIDNNVYSQRPYKMARTLRQAQKKEERQVEESESEAEPVPGEEAAEYLEETLSWALLVLVNKTETKTKTPGGPKPTTPFFNCLLQSTNFGQPETGPVCRFRFCFLDIRIRTIQLKHEGWGAFFGLQPTRIILWASTH